METPIADIDSYNNSMAAAMEDKLYFLPLLEDKKLYTVIDYGCADGAMIKFLASKYPMLHFIGIDNNSHMIDRAISKTIHMPNVEFHTGGNEVLGYYANDSHAMVILNSVLHEVYSYNKYNSAADFWTILAASEFRYICIRDMYIEPSKDNITWTIEAYNKIFDSEWYKEDSSLKGRLIDFFSHYDINRYNMLMFLLKCRYAKNWLRERDENYSPYAPENIIRLLETNKKVLLNEKYPLPYNVKIIKNLFDIDINNINTHYKLIFANYDIPTVKLGD